MDLSLRDKVAIVTGGSSGIGKAIAFALSEEGTKVVISARREELLKKVAEEIQSATGSEVSAVKADVTKLEDIKNLVNKTIEKFGRIDILVNNAGIADISEFLTLSDDDWQEEVNVNLFAVIRCSREVLPHMIKQRSGRIINISSIFGKYGPPLVHDYNVTKAGVLAFTKTLSDEVAKYNILVNSVCPGRTRTPLWDKLAIQLSPILKVPPEEVFEVIATQCIPLGRYGKPEEIASVVTFLASEKASFITGASINVDGGETKFCF